MCREHLVFKLGPVAGDDVGARALAPPLIRHSDDCGFGHQGVRTDGVLNFDGRDVLAAGDDDVLRAILQFDVAVGVHDTEVAGVQPAAGKGLCCGFGVAVVAGHDGVAAHHDFADRRPVGGHIDKKPVAVGLALYNAQLAGTDLPHTLPCQQRGPRVGREVLPFVLFVGDRVGAGGFSHAEGVSDGESERFDLGQCARVQWCPAARDAQRVVQPVGFVGGQHSAHDGRCAVEVSDPVAVNELPDLRSAHCPQTHLGAAGCGERPHAAPAVAVEDRQGPQVDAVGVEAGMQHLVDRVRVRLTVGDDDALGIACCAGGVVDPQRVEFAVGRPLELTRCLPGLVCSRLLGLG